MSSGELLLDQLQRDLPVQLFVAGDEDLAETSPGERSEHSKSKRSRDCDIGQRRRSTASTMAFARLNPSRGVRLSRTSVSATFQVVEECESAGNSLIRAASNAERITPS